MFRSIVLFTFTFLLICLELIAQSPDKDQSNFQYGVGIDLPLSHQWINSLLPPPNITVSLQLFDQVRIEPGIGFRSINSDAEDNETDSERNLFGYSLESHWLFNVDKLSPYVGLYFDHTSHNFEFGDRISGVREELRSSRFGPLLGVNYKISDHLSFGTVFMFLRLNEKSTYENFGVSPEIEETSKGFESVARLRVRFFL